MSTPRISVDLEQTISAREVADQTGLSFRTIQHWAAKGIIPGAFQAYPRARWRFGRTQFQQWWDVHRPSSNGDGGSKWEIPQNQQPSISATAAAHYTGLSLWLIQTYCRRGLIPGAFKLGSGKGARWRFKRREFEQWWAIQGSAAVSR